jgi:hypothetical protein
MSKIHSTFTSMKKVFIFITALIYMAVSTGVAMEIHYCMGKEAGVEYFANENETCGKCGMKEKGKNGCCHDEHKFVKLEDSHKNVFNTLDFNCINYVAIIQEYSSFNCSIVPQVVATSITDTSPPNYNTPKLCILNCTFRI